MLARGPVPALVRSWLLLITAVPVAGFAQPAAGDLPGALQPALERAAELPRLHSLLISHQGNLVVERYYNGRGPDDIANIKSASKSIISALVGAAIERGHLQLDQSIAPFFPAHADLLEGDKARISIRDLLTMQSGLETTSNRNYGRWVLSDDWVRFALSQPLEDPPGTVMEYSTGDTHLLSAILNRATGESTLEFARRVLGRPLGFRLADWPTDPQGIHFGGNDMEFTPRQMLRFGRLYLEDGRHDGRQVLPADWVEASLEAQTVSPRGRGDRYYGYGWWIRDMAGYRTTYAWGYGGQFILLVDELDLVVVTTSSSQPGEGRRQHTRAIYRLAEYDIIAPLAEALGKPVPFADDNTVGGGAAHLPDT